MKVEKTLRKLGFLLLLIPVSGRNDNSDPFEVYSTVKSSADLATLRLKSESSSMSRTRMPSSITGGLREVQISQTPRLLKMDPQSNYRLKLDKVTENTAFIIIEAHSLRLPLLLAKSELTYEIVNSTSPAIFTTPSDLEGTAILSNVYKENNTVLVFARLYNADSPVPGKCNTKPGVPIKPYLETSWSQSMVSLTFNQAGTLHSCSNIVSLTYDVYQYFLPENDCSLKYFEAGYRSYIDVEDIRSKGDFVTTLTHHSTAINLTNYPRTGRIIAVIVNTKNASAVYGLAHTYGCHLDSDSISGCKVHDSTLTWISCALGVFVGLFLTFVGHRFFKCSQFLFGFYFGSFIGFIMFSILIEVDDKILTILSASTGLVFAVAFLCLWWFLGIPVLSVLLPTLEVGFVLASFLMYLPLCGVDSFYSDTTYWLVFICITLSPTVLFIAFTQKASILGSVVIGSTTVILAVDHYTGSNIKFIFNNVLNRIILVDFGASYRCPPFQRMDLLLVTCLLGGMALGLVCQLIIERKKAPFPPAPYQQWRWARSYEVDDEHTPLINGEVIGSPEEPSRTPVVGYISGHTSNNTSMQRNASRVKPVLQTTSSGAALRRDIFSPSASLNA